MGNLIVGYLMEIVYANNKTEHVCTDFSAALRFFGGNKPLAVSLMARINAIESADVIKDIILSPPFHFHKLIGGITNYFAIDVKTRRDKWRIILTPLNEDKEEYIPCTIDKISSYVKIIEIKEVSAHYE